jgi:hypothetical protein
MKRVALWTIAGAFLAVFVLSSNTAWMKDWTEYRFSEKSALPADRYRFGDLYGFSYLPAYKFRAFQASDLKPYLVRNRPVTNVHLYGLVDSYLYFFLHDDSLLHHADAYRYVRWGVETKQFHLDSSKTNVLLVEIVERYVRTSLPYPDWAIQHLSVVDHAAQEGTGELKATSWSENHVFNKNIEQNLAHNLTEYSFFTPAKELKAQLNHKVFGRINPDVAIAGIPNQLYYAPTVKAGEPTSSFTPVRAGELDTLINNLNQMYSHYRKAGFAEVYLAIMPNPVTILEPQRGTYNGLIPKIQQHPRLRMPVLDMYATLRRLKDAPIYQRSDSHWSKTGFLAGIGVIDSALATHASARGNK